MSEEKEYRAKGVSDVRCYTAYLTHRKSDVFNEEVYRRIQTTWSYQLLRPR
jgi:hypothetical protein